MRAPGLGATRRAGVWRARCVVGRRWQGMALRRCVRLASHPARPQRGVRFMGEQALTILPDQEKITMAVDLHAREPARDVRSREIA